MFYVNNEVIKCLYIGDRPYNYIVSGFSKIVPEDRNVDVLNLNLAWAFLNSYRVEYGNLEDGYTNAPIKRIDKPDYNNIYHTPFTFYDGNNIVPTKNVPIVITNGFYAFVQGNVYNDININGNYARLAYNVDFQGKTIRTNSEHSEYERYLSDNVFEGCNNFTAELKSKYGTGYSVLYNCNNFAGNFKFEGNSDELPGLGGFLTECKDGKFNIDVTNMRGGGSSANTGNRLDFECMRYCDNVDLNLTGSSWQSWPQMYAFSYNCNINTFNIIPGFGGVDNSNINVVLPKDSTPEISGTYEFLRGSDNCNYKLIGSDCNLYNFYAGVGGSYMFTDLNDCNLNLLLNNSVVMDKTFGNHLNFCNIKFDDIGVDMSTHEGWYDLHDCNIQGNVVRSDYNNRGFIEGSNNLNLNLNVYGTNKIDVLRFVNDSKGNIVMGKESHIKHSNNLNINTNLGNLQLYNVSNSNFKLNSTNTVLYSSSNLNITNGTVSNITDISNCNDVYITDARELISLQNSRNVKINNSGKFNITSLNNLFNCSLRTLASSVSHTIFSNNIKNCNLQIAETNFSNLNNVDNSFIRCKCLNGYIDNARNSTFVCNDGSLLKTWRVNDCSIIKFPVQMNYTYNCTFGSGLSSLPSGFTWKEIWPHKDDSHVSAGVNSIENVRESCFIYTDDYSTTSERAWSNNNNMQTNLDAFYNTVFATLPNYNMDIKLNVDCNILYINQQQAGPPHGFGSSSISANTIYSIGTAQNALLYANLGVRCFSNYSTLSWYTGYDINNTNQPVIVTNNARPYSFSSFGGGLFCYKSFNMQNTANIPTLQIRNGTCMFINNARFVNVIINNAMLYLGTNVTIYGSINVTNGGYICNKANVSEGQFASKVFRGNTWCWNVYDKGPWGNQSLVDYCRNV